jgi:hypothetical protein
MPAHIRTLLNRIRDVIVRLLRKLRPYPRGLRYESSVVRGQRYRAFQAADRVEKRLGAARIVIEAADGAMNVIHGADR